MKKLFFMFVVEFYGGKINWPGMVHVIIKLSSGTCSIVSEVIDIIYLFIVKQTNWDFATLFAGKINWPGMVRVTKAGRRGI